MNYHLTLINDHGIILEETVDLAVTDDIKWHDFEQLAEVRLLLMRNPTMKLLDVTPDGMPSWYTDEQILTLTMKNMGQRKRLGSRGEPVYEDIEDLADVDVDLLATGLCPDDADQL